MGTWDNRTTQYISSGKYASVTAWSAGATVTKGNLVRQLATPSVGNERVFLCITGGTTGGSEPAWNLSTGATTTDNSATWLEVTGAAALNGDLANTPKWANGGGTGRTPNTSQTITDAAGTHAFVCTVSGSTGGTEPSWNTSAVGNTTTDGSATWMYLGTTGTLTKWACPHARVATALSSNWTSNNGFGQVNFYHVGNSHNENSGSGTSLNWSAGNTETNGGLAHITCVNESGNVPPQTSDITTGAVATAGGNSNSVNMAGYFRMTGIELAIGGTGNTQLNIATDNNADKEYVNCIFNVGSSNGGCTLQFPPRQHGKAVFRNCSVIFAAAGQQISMDGNVRWYGGSIGKTGTALTSQIFIQSDCCDILFKGVDFSNALGSGTPYIMVMSGSSGNEQLRFEDCIMPTNAGTTPSTINHIFSHANGSGWLELIRCGSDYEYARYNGNGSIVASSKATRSSGATDSITAFGWVVTTDASFVNPWNNYLECPPVVTWNSAVGSPALTADVYGISWDTALPTNKDIWIEIDVEKDVSDTLGNRVSTRVADIFTTPTSWSADTSHWDGNAPARVNSHTYVAGDFIADPASNGRLYLCTTGGAAASSLPGGYSSAVDGSSITDGAATFKAGFRFLMSQPVDIHQAGNLQITVCFGKSGTLTYAIDPMIVI